MLVRPLFLRKHIFAANDPGFCDDSLGHFASQSVGGLYAAPLAGCLVLVVLSFCRNIFLRQTIPGFCDDSLGSFCVSVGPVGLRRTARRMIGAWVVSTLLLSVVYSLSIRSSLDSYGSEGGSANHTDPTNQTAKWGDYEHCCTSQMTSPGGHR